MLYEGDNRSVDRFEAYVAEGKFILIVGGVLSFLQAAGTLLLFNIINSRLNVFNFNDSYFLILLLVRRVLIIIRTLELRLLAWLNIACGFRGVALFVS